MARIGLNNFRYAKLLNPSTDEEPTYDGAKKPAKAISCNVSITNNSATLYADDTLAESDTSFQSGTVTIGIDEDDLETMAALLGHTVTDGEIVRNSSDAAPYVGFGRIVVKMVNGIYKYKVEFLYKVKFSEPSVENQTKGESLEFSTTEIEGSVAALNNGNWSVAKTFDTKDDAITYLEGLMADSTPTPTPTVTLTYDANGGTGSVDSKTVNAGSSITLSDGTGLTAPSGKSFKGWGTTSSATETVSSPYTINENTTLYAVWQDV